ncbi:hypothetical protein [Gorillibacterium massiliense]|uniref:hypothetical protein n=1 Tax=Gorillibacterium massiliense TaxID=1280390 RepID=UPI0004B43D51|nr:hypothetical protein [Gorillibacterium massiliense]
MKTWKPDSHLDGFCWAAEWERKEQNLQSLLEKIEQEKGEEFSIEHAYAQIHEGYTVRSGKEIMRLNLKKELLIGTLLPDGKYSWLQMDYFPPYFLELKWHIVPEKKGSKMKLI